MADITKIVLVLTFEETCYMLGIENVLLWSSTGKKKITNTLPTYQKAEKNTRKTKHSDPDKTPDCIKNWCHLPGAEVKVAKSSQSLQAYLPLDSLKVKSVHPFLWPTMLEHLSFSEIDGLISLQY